MLAQHASNLGRAADFAYDERKRQTKDYYADTLGYRNAHRSSSLAGMPLTPDQERWGVAAAVIKQHGHNAQEHAIGRIRHFAERADDEGMRFWIDISRRIYDLTKTPDSGLH